MIRSIVTIALLIMLSSCGGNTKQIDVVKAKISSYKNSDQEEINDYKFEVYNLKSKDAYARLVKYWSSKASEEMKDGDRLNTASIYLEKSAKYLKLQSKDKDLDFHVVNAYRIVANDTVSNEDYYLNEKDSIIAKHKGI